MKKIFLISTFLVLLVLGCEEKTNKIELLPNLESEYLSEKEVDTPIEVKSEDSVLKNSLIDAVKSIHNSSPKDSIRYIISLRLYVNEKGKVDKVKDISTYYDRLEFGTDGLKNYTDRKTLNESIVSKLSEWSFIPAQKNGANVKSYADLNNVNVVALPDGKFEIELPDFLSAIFSDNQFRVNADEMPFPMGGLSELTKNVVYPEDARNKGIEGKVFVIAFINENGDVVKTRIAKGENPILNDAAKDAVSKTKFTPGRVEGKPVKVQVTIPIVFKLQ
mgnify:CR=1 FL=1